MQINIKVKPNSSKNEIIRLDEKNWEIRVSEPSIEGQANKAVIALIAKDLGVSKSRVSIISGLKSKMKKIEIISG